MQHTPYWWDAAGEPDAPESPITLPAKADVVVIGAGLTGLSAARTLARAGRDVLVVESGAPGSGASSRNGGQVGGGHRLPPASLDAQYGKDTATRLLREAHIDSIDFFTSLIDDESIDCDWQPVGRFRGCNNRREYEQNARALEQLNRRIGTHAYPVKSSEQQSEIATDLYHGGTVFPTHGAINPAKFTYGLWRAARDAGAAFACHTSVLGVSTNARASIVKTTRGDVIAGAVLAATNGYSTTALPTIARRIVPVPSFIVATETLGRNRVRALMPSGRVYVESRARHCYFRPSPDGERLVFGGRAALCDVPDRFATSQLRSLMLDVFPELSGAALTHSWRGHTGFSFAQIPHVGTVDGVEVAMGYSGNGNTMAPYLGHKAALRILGDADAETAFSQTAFETRFWHRGKRWFLPAADMRFRVQDIWQKLTNSL